MRFTVPIIIIAFCIIFKMIVNRNPKSDPDAEFLELERKANLTPRKDISHLPYIQVPVDSLPLDLPTDKEEVLERQDIIRSMADKKVLNLTGRTNTDLKLEYGAPNINILSAADNNYTRLVQAIAYLASDYIDSGHKEEAIQLLEYGISIGTDSKKNYLTLASLYKEQGQESKIQDLITSAESVDSLLKDSIIASLQELL
jgi:tetratricopeptide (TPR) repeat protein